MSMLASSGAVQGGACLGRVEDVDDSEGDTAEFDDTKEEEIIATWQPKCPHVGHVCHDNVVAKHERVPQRLYHEPTGDIPDDELPENHCTQPSSSW